MLQQLTVTVHVFITALILYVTWNNHHVVVRMARLRLNTVKHLTWIITLDVIFITYSKTKNYNFITNGVNFLKKFSRVSKKLYWEILLEGFYVFFQKGIINFSKFKLSHLPFCTFINKTVIGKTKSPRALSSVHSINFSISSDSQNIFLICFLVFRLIQISSRLEIRANF